jgi:TonB family protein
MITVDLAPMAVSADAVTPGDAAQSVPDTAEPQPVDPTVATEPPLDMTAAVAPTEATITPPETPREIPPDPARAVAMQQAEPLPPDLARPVGTVQAEQPPPDEIKPIETVEAAAIVPDDTPQATRPDDVIVPVQPARAVVAQALPEPKPAPQVRPKPAPKAERPTRHAVPRPSQAAPRRAAGANELGGSGARADPNVLNSYVARVRADLERHKRYPPEARSERISGMPTIVVTLARSGKLLSASIARSSGKPVLDQAALAMARAADPLPAMPDDLGRSQLSLRVPVDFSLR